MKDSTKLFLGAVGIVACGLLKGIAPIALDQPFDNSSFLIICIIAMIVVMLGIIKRRKGK